MKSTKANCGDVTWRAFYRVGKLDSFTVGLSLSVWNRQGGGKPSRLCGTGQTLILRACRPADCHNDLDKIIDTTDAGNNPGQLNASRNCFFMASENPTKLPFYSVRKFNVVAAWCRRMEPAPGKECRFPLSTLKPAGVDRSNPMMARLTATAAPLRKVCSSMNLKKPCGDFERGHQATQKTFHSASTPENHAALSPWIGFCGLFLA